MIARQAPGAYSLIGLGLGPGPRRPVDSDAGLASSGLIVFGVLSGRLPALDWPEGRF